MLTDNEDTAVDITTNLSYEIPRNRGVAVIACTTYLADFRPAARMTLSFLYSCDRTVICERCAPGITHKLRAAHEGLDDRPEAHAEVGRVHGQQ